MEFPIFINNGPVHFHFEGCWLVFFHIQILLEHSASKQLKNPDPMPLATCNHVYWIDTVYIYLSQYSCFSVKGNK